MSDRDEFYQRLFDSMFDGVYLVDVEKKIIYWNKGAKRISGYSSEEMIGLSCHNKILVHMDDSGTDSCKGKCPFTDTLTDNSIFTTEGYINHKDGHQVPVTIEVSPLWDEDGNCIGGVEIFKRK